MFVSGTNHFFTSFLFIHADGVRTAISASSSVDCFVRTTRLGATRRVPSVHMFVIPNANRAVRDMRRDMKDILEMRFQGVSYAAFELRWSLIHVDELILDAENGKTPSVLMSRVTDSYWKKFAYDVSASFEMFGFVLWGVRKERVSAKDDPERRRKYGTGYSDYVYVRVPFVIPFLSVDVEPGMDDEYREIVTPLDEHGKPKKNVFVSYSRRCGYRVKQNAFQTECGALLLDWRRYTNLMRVHDVVSKQSAELMPYVEHMTQTEQTRLSEESRAVEQLLHPPIRDEFGYDVPQEKVLKKVKREDETIQSFVQVPENRRISAAQPQPKLVFDAQQIHKSWIAQLSATLQIPLRHMQMEENKGLGAAGNEATIQDDVARSVRVASERRNEIVDVLSEAFEKIYDARPQNVHLPVATHMKPQMLFELHDRGLISHEPMIDELSAALGVKRQKLFSDRDV